MDGCFHDEATILGPDFKVLGRGADTCIRSYVDFLQQAKVRDCTLSEPDIQVTGEAAVAAYGWKMTYELNGKEYTEAGHDLFVFTCVDGRWLAIWRALLPSAGAA